tara:strand:- start:156 stop:320 length:165 start_codon:yes stop_codon:yes gene_type:complete
MKHLKEFWPYYIIILPMGLWLSYVVMWAVIGTFCNDCPRKYNNWWVIEKSEKTS